MYVVLYTVAGAATRAMVTVLVASAPTVRSVGTTIVSAEVTVTTAVWVTGAGVVARQLQAEDRADPLGYAARHLGAAGG